MTALTGTGASSNVLEVPAICGAASLVGKEHLALTIGASDRTVILASATTDVGLGILTYAGAVGEPVRYAVAGECLVKCGGTATRGQRGMVDATDAGKLLNATSGVQTFGTFLESGADGDLVRFQINPLPAGSAE